MDMHSGNIGKLLKTREDLEIQLVGKLKNILNLKILT